MDISIEDRIKLFTSALDQIGLSDNENEKAIEDFVRHCRQMEDTLEIQAVDKLIEHFITEIKALAPKYGGKGDTELFEEVRGNLRNQIRKNQHQMVKDLHSLKGVTIH